MVAVVAAAEAEVDAAVVGVVEGARTQMYALLFDPYLLLISPVTIFFVSPWP
jgi:hypothetical protein